ncbi:MAG: hypothetical protein N2578_05220, partial [Bdellovibrionaceae bacterium]|nr:hypothetical protein [Pseudobdellovibrionaceae bacterium]
MAKPILIMVCDNHELVETARRYWEGHDVDFQVYTPAQWREGLDSTLFRDNLAKGLPALPVGGYSGSNVVTFPQNGLHPPKVTKIEEMEARAIEDAIHQYKG